MTIAPDVKAPTASGKTMKSGYGFTEKVTTRVATNQSSAVTAAQNAVTYFPEFQYQGFWRLLDRMGSGYNMTHEFKVNRYSTYQNRTHFTPIWYPDGSYTPYTWLIDCWTPAYAASGDVARAIEGTWTTTSQQIKTVVDNVVFPAILFACLVFTLAAPLYVWQILGM